MMNKANQLKLGALISYLQMGLGIVIGLVYTPMMIRLLGKSEHGLYNTVSSVISMLSLLNLGFNSGYIRYYSKYKKENDKDAISKLNGLFLIIFLIIGAVAFLCGTFLSFHLDLVFDEGLTPGEYKIARVLMLLLTVNLAITFPMSVFSNIISAHERFVFLKLLGVMKTVAAPFVSIPLLLCGFRSIALVSVTLGISLVTDLMYLIYVFGVLHEKFVFHDFEKGLFKSLFVYTGFIAINLIVDQINWNIDKLLLGRFKGTEAVSIYSVGYSLYQYYMMFSTAISNVFTPRIHFIIDATADSMARRRKELSDLFTKVGRIQFLLLGLVATGLVFFGRHFIYFWADSSYSDSYYVMLLLVLSASITLIQNLGIEIQRAENKHRFRSYVYLMMALINLVLSVFLCRAYGAVGSAVGTAISLVFANGLIMNIYYHKRCDIDIIGFWKSIARLSAGLVLPIICGILMLNFVNLYSIWLFFGCIAVYTVVYCLSMWLIGMNRYEKNLVLKPIKKILRITE